jgi:hypothetical protein
MTFCLYKNFWGEKERRGENLPFEDPINNCGIDKRIETDTTKKRKIKSQHNPHESNFIMHFVWGICFNPAEDVMVVDTEAISCGREPYKGQREAKHKKVELFRELKCGAFLGSRMPTEKYSSHAFRYNYSTEEGHEGKISWNTPINLASEIIPIDSR